jgi:hypothetical protein
MKVMRISMLAVLVTVTLIGSIAAATIPLQQQAYAPRNCGGCVEFKKTTHELEKSVINAIGDPDITPGPRELLSAYVDDVNRIFLGGPDTIPGLLEQYELAVLAVFQAPPEPDKQAQHDQIKEFRQLTNGFEKGVLCLIIQPCVK